MQSFHEAARPCAIFSVLAASVVALVGTRAAFADEVVTLSNKVLTRGTSQVDAAVVADDMKVTSTAIATLKTSNQSLTRLESAWTYDPDESRFRLRLGDSTSDAGHWGSAVRFAGLQWGTGLSPRQDLLDAPRLALSGASIVPTVADAMLGAVHSPSTSFTARGLSAGKITPNGAGLALTARDAAGRSTSVTKSLVAKPRSVEEGCRSYSLSFGRLRENYGLDESTYGPVFANTTVACGLGDGRSIEAHANTSRATPRSQA